MEEDIKILEDVLKDKDTKLWIGEQGIQVIENLIQRFYVVKSEYKREEYRNELLEEEIREYRNNFIPKSKVKEKIEELEERNISYFDIVRYLKDLLEGS